VITDDGLDTRAVDTLRAHVDDVVACPTIWAS
jgi:hypothetical protein